MITWALEFILLLLTYQNGFMISVESAFHRLHKLAMAGFAGKPIFVVKEDNGEMKATVTFAQLSAEGTGKFIST